VTDLVLEIIPPIRPSLLYASLFLNDRIFNHRTQYAERHGDTMIIIAMNTDTPLQLYYRPSSDLEAIVEFDGFDAELCCYVL